MSPVMLTRIIPALALSLMSAAAPLAHAAAAPDIARFEAETVPDLSAGTELTFRVTGTRGAAATVVVPGVKQPVRLRETAPGVYEGSYTIKKADRPRTNIPARAILRKNNVSTTVRLERPLASGVAAAPAAAPRIERFAMEPGTIDPGTELTFMLHGTPGAKVTVTIANTVRGIAMTEMQPGIYEARYTVRRQDRFGAPDVTATLAAADGPPVRARLAAVPAPAAPAAPVTSVSPPEGARVTQPFTVSGTLANSVDPRSVRILFGNNDVTREATVTTSGFSYRPAEPLPPGRYRVDVSTRDNQGNAARTAWSFEITSPAAPAAGAGFPLEIISPRNQADIGNAPVEIRGRTAPGATLDVSVDATAALFGPIGFNRNLMRQNVQADARGNFAFTFDPRGNPSGTRYEITAEGTLNGEHKRAALTLVQR